MTCARLCRSTALALVLVLACTDDETDLAEGGEDVDHEPYCEQDAPPTDTDPPVESEPTCALTPGDHSAAQCSSDACPITTDVVLSCDRELTQLGLRVATSETHAYLLSSSDDRAMLLTASGPQGTFEPALPLDSLRQTALLDRGLAGELYVAADREGGVVVLRSAQDVWTEIFVSASESGSIARIHDLESDGNAVHAWYDAGAQWPLHFTYTFVNSQAATGFDYPITPGSQTQWTLDHAGSPVSFSFAEQPDGWQLGARQFDFDTARTTDAALGSPVFACSPLAYRPVPPSKPSAPAVEVPSYSVVIQHPDGLRIAWPETELSVPETSLAAVACSSDGAARGLVNDGFGVAQTTDGRLWLVWVDARACEPEQDSLLHVASFDFETGELSHQLGLPIEPLAPIVRQLEPDNARMLDVRAWATHLAIGLRLRNGQGVAVARLIQIDTSLF